MYRFMYIYTVAYYLENILIAYGLFFFAMICMIFNSFTASTSVDCNSRFVTQECYVLCLISLQLTRVQMFFCRYKNR